MSVEKTLQSYVIFFNYPPFAAIIFSQYANLRRKRGHGWGEKYRPAGWMFAGGTEWVDRVIQCLCQSITTRRTAVVPSAAVMRSR